MNASLAQGLLTGHFVVRAQRETMTGETAQPAEAEPSSEPCCSPAPLTHPSSFSSQPEAQYFRSVAQMGVQVAEALQYAHQQGILHRDIKPSNLLLDLHGTVWIADFGLAKNVANSASEIGEEADLTGTGDVVGTLRYMAQERLSGVSDPRSDVYGLGITLYELLTLRQPFEDSNRARLIERLMHEDPPRPRKLDRHIPRDLETIVLNATAKEPGRRYPTAAELAQELRRFLAGEPIKRRPIGVCERMVKWIKRRPAAAALLVVSTVALIALTIGTLIHNAQLGAALEDTAAHLAQVELAERATKSQLALARFQDAENRRLGGLMGRRFESLLSLKKAAELYRSLEQLDEHALKLRNEAISAMTVTDLSVGPQWELPPSWRGKGPFFDATLEHYALTDGKDHDDDNAKGNISVRRVSDHQEIAHLPGPGTKLLGAQAQVVRFSPDGQFLAAVYKHQDGLLRPVFWVWDRRRGQTVLELKGVSNGSFDFSPDSRDIVVGRKSDGKGALYELQLYDLPSGKEGKCLGTHWAAELIRFHPSGKKVAYATPGRFVHVLDLKTGRKLDENYNEATRLGSAGLLDSTKTIKDVAWGVGDTLAVASDDFQVILWDMAISNPKQKEFKGHHGETVSVAFNHAGDLLVSSGLDGTTRLWDLRTGRQLLSAASSGKGTFSKDDRRLAYGSLGHKVWLWEVASSQEYRGFHGHTGKLQPWSADIAPPHPTLSPRGRGQGEGHGRWMASTDGSKVFLWDLAAVRETDKKVAELPVASCRAVFFHPNGDSLFTAGSKGFERWPISHAPDGLRIGAPQTVVEPKSGVSGGACLSLNGRTVAVIAISGQLKVFDLEQPDQKITLAGHHNLAYVTISPDGKWVATGARDGADIKVWAARSGDLFKTLPASAGSTALFSSDGRWLAVNSKTGTFLHEIGSWEARRPVGLKDANVHAEVKAFARDGRMAAVLHSPEWLIQLIDPATGREFATLKSPDPQPPSQLCFSSDGSQLVVACPGHALQVWDLRLIRQQLAQMGLDWDLPAYPPLGDGAPKPLRVTVEKVR